MKLISTVSISAFFLGLLFIPSSLNAQDMEFGTSRRPRTCASRSQPVNGAISAQQAIKYFICDTETINSSALGARFVTDLNLQVAPKPRRVTEDDIGRAARINNQIDTDKPVYDIRGSFKRYSCTNKPDWVAQKQNCSLNVFSNSQGICFKNNFGDWHCTMQGKSPLLSEKFAPPQ
jgi:hypothetical protein